jgi:hypothetical protein
MKVTTHKDGTVSLRVAAYNGELSDLLYAVEVTALQFKADQYKSAPHWWGDPNLGTPWVQYCKERAERLEEIAAALKGDK